MNNPPEARWRQRLVHFERSMARLTRAGTKTRYSELELAGLVQTFEFSFELAWKTLRDYLHHEGIDAASPRATLRESHRVELINDIDLWLEALEARNRLAHIYDEKMANDAVRAIKESYYPILQTLLETLLRLRGQDE